MLDTMTLMQKADMALADLSSGGVLQEAQAKEFVRLVIKKAVVSKMARVVPMGAQKQLVEKMRFGSRVLQPGTSGVALSEAQRSKPDLSMVELDSQLYKAEVRIPDEVAEDNIERGTFPATVMELLSDAIARDIDDMAWNSDSASSDAFYAKQDGWLKLFTSNSVDAAGARLSKTLMKNAIKAQPTEWRDSSVDRFLVAPNPETDYRDSLADRATAVGDKYLEGDVPVKYSGRQIVPVPVALENLGGGGNQSEGLLTNPKNLLLGFWRKVRIETDRDKSAGVMLIIGTLRAAVDVEEESSGVKLQAILSD